MALARGTMETIKRIFSWTLSWQDLFSRCGCFFQIFGDIVPMTYATSNNTITALRNFFSYFGLPEHLVTD